MSTKFFSITHGFQKRGRNGSADHIDTFICTLRFPLQSRIWVISFFFSFNFILSGMEIIYRTRRNADTMRIQKLCFVILQRLVSLHDEWRLALSTYDPLLAHCFGLLKYTTLTETACDLIVTLLLSRNDLVQLDGFSMYL